MRRPTGRAFGKMAMVPTPDRARQARPRPGIAGAGEDTGSPPVASTRRIVSTCRRVSGTKASLSGTGMSMNPMKSGSNTAWAGPKSPLGNLGADLHRLAGDLDPRRVVRMHADRLPRCRPPLAFLRTGADRDGIAVEGQGRPARQAAGQGLSLWPRGSGCGEGSGAAGRGKVLRLNQTRACRTGGLPLGTRGHIPNRGPPCV